LLVVILIASWLKGFLYVVVVSAHNNIHYANTEVSCQRTVHG